MIQVDQHEGSYLSICKHYRAIYDTPCILEDESKWQQVPFKLALIPVLYFLALLFYKKHCHFICNLVLFKTENVLCIFQALKSVVLYVILAPYDNEQSDLVHRISIDKKLEEIPKYR